MQTVQILQEASRRIYESVKDIAGTDHAAGDFGRGAGGDISRRIDIIAEKTVLDYLKEVQLRCTVLGEECGRVELSDDPEGFVIMDAIDGSANAVRGIPFFCSSLAFAKDYRLSSISDAAIANLATGQIYWASRGSGAYLDGKRISVQDDNPVYRIIGINTSGSSAELMRRMQPIFENHNHTRHFGANALEMAFFSQGLMDIFIDLRGKIRVQDIAAGYLLIKEAGGLVLDENLEPLDSDFDYKTRLSFVAAANEKVLKDIMAQIKG